MKSRKKPGWLEIASRLQAIAQAGLEFGHSEYDRERYAQLRQISIDIIKDHTEYEEEMIRELFASETGYPTPKVDVRAAIFRGDSILLVKEKVDGKWSLPGGWADQHLTIKENLVKESMEEAGVEVIPRKILGIFDRRIHNYPPIPYGCYKIFVECELLHGEFTANTETSESGFFSPDEIPPLSSGRNTAEQVEYCFRARNASNDVWFD